MKRQLLRVLRLWGVGLVGGLPFGRSSTCGGEWFRRRCRDRGREVWRVCLGGRGRRGHPRLEVTRSISFCERSQAYDAGAWKDYCGCLHQFTMNMAVVMGDLMWETARRDDKLFEKAVSLNPAIDWRVVYGCKQEDSCQSST